MAEMNFDIEMKGMDLFHENLVLLEKEFPNDAKRLLQNVGNKAAVIVRKKARQLVHKVTGNYQKSIKRGKVWKGEDGKYYVRVYSKDPKQFLIEYGHRIIDKKGQEHGFKEGYHVFGKAVDEMDSKFEEILVKEFDKIMNKL